MKLEILYKAEISPDFDITFLERVIVNLTYSSGFTGSKLYELQVIEGQENIPQLIGEFVEIKGILWNTSNNLEIIPWKRNIYYERALQHYREALYLYNEAKRIANAAKISYNSGSISSIEDKISLMDRLVAGDCKEEWSQQLENPESSGSIISKIESEISENEESTSLIRQILERIFN